MDYKAVQAAGRGRDWDYSPGGDAEKAVIQALNNFHPTWVGRSRLALGLDMSYGRLETLLWRLAKTGFIDVTNKDGYVLWRGRESPSTFPSTEVDLPLD